MLKCVRNIERDFSEWTQIYSLTGNLLLQENNFNEKISAIELNRFVTFTELVTFVYSATNISKGIRA